MPARRQAPEQAGADLEALSDLCTPWCIRVVATLRIAEHVAAGSTDIDQLAAAAGCHADALHHVLGHLVGKGVFEERAPGRFALNDAARGLLDQSRFLDLEGVGGRFAGAWTTLLAYARTGAPGYQEVFGLPFWEDLAAHPDIAASFDALMGPAGHGTPDADIPITGGWESVRKVLNDWPDRETTAILRRCAEAARPGGRVVVLGGVAAADTPRRLTIEMVLLGARSSTLTEFRGLAAEAGLEVSVADRHLSGHLVVECRPT